MAEWTKPRKLTHEQAKEEQRLEASRMSMAERLAAMTELNARMRRMRGIERDERTADWTVSRVSRPKR